MPIVLVVDDSRFDRRLIGGLIEKDIDWLVEYADNGAEALERMRIAAPDIVVSDMLMPEMGGLEFVANVRDEFSQVPVVVVTGQGSEVLASQALRAGAASYVPKADLADGLLATIEQVLLVASSTRDLERLMQSAASVRHEFHLDNDPKMISVLVGFVQRTMDQMQFCPATTRLHVALALEEAILNAIHHGNLELPQDSMPAVRKDLHSARLSSLIEERRADPAFADRAISVVFQVNEERAEFVIRDQGAGFDTSTVPSREMADFADAPRGRGLVLIQNFMDAVKFNDSGNAISMIKLRDLQPQ